MDREQMKDAVAKLSNDIIANGHYVDSDNGEPFDHADFCFEHASMVAQIEALESGVVCWVSTTCMGSDGHRECSFGGCHRHLDFGGLTDYGINSALGLTEEDPKQCSVYASELMLSAWVMSVDDPRWELWEFHARRVIRRAKRFRARRVHKQ